MESCKNRGYWVSTSELKLSVCRLERCGRWKDARQNFHWWERWLRGSTGQKWAWTLELDTPEEHLPCVLPVRFIVTLISSSIFLRR